MLSKLPTTTLPVCIISLILHGDSLSCPSGFKCKKLMGRRRRQRSKLIGIGRYNSPIKSLLPVWGPLTDANTKQIIFTVTTKLKCVMLGIWTTGFKVRDILSGGCKKLKDLLIFQSRWCQVERSTSLQKWLISKWDDSKHVSISTAKSSWNNAETHPQEQTQLISGLKLREVASKNHFI